MKKNDTRDLIIEKTFKLLLEKGYDGVSISNIQKSLNISRGLLYHYFSSKELLFFEAAKHYFITLFQIDSFEISTYNIEDMINYIVEKHNNLMTGVMKDIPIIKYDFLIYRMVQESEELLLLYKNCMISEKDGWIKAVENSIKNSELRKNIDAELVARQFVHIVDGVWLGAIIPQSEKTLISNLKDSLEVLYTLIKINTDE